MKYFKLQGDASQVAEAPIQCTKCQCKELFKQPDFNRSSGVFIVGFASLLTIVFQYYAFNWYLTWSPMLLALIVDRTLAWTSHTAVICYDCEHIYRGFSKDKIPKEVGDFSLETYDRYKYPERQANQHNV